MKITLYSAKRYDKDFFRKINEQGGYNYEFQFVTSRLEMSTLDRIRPNTTDVVCIFVNDDASRPVLEALKGLGVKAIALRCAGFNNVDLVAAKELGLEVVRVPAYSPEAVAEHAVALLQTLNRNVHRAYNRTRDGNFSLENLTGVNLYKKTAGIIGTGKIGLAAVRILKGFGMRVLAYDPYQSEAAIEAGAEYTDLDTIYRESDVISLHCPLFKENTHMLNAEAFSKMKDGVLIINSSRGALLDTNAAIDALRSGKIGGLGLDVYENEQALFFDDKSNHNIMDDLFLRLIASPNVILTGHQAFLTVEALTAIADVTLGNCKEIASGVKPTNSLID